MTESSVVTAPTRVDQHAAAHPKRVRWTLGLVAAGIFVALAGVPGVLISLQLSHLDMAGRLGDLAVISAVGALVNVIMIPVWGSVSDRTRSRLGRRAPIASESPPAASHPRFSVSASCSARLPAS